MSPFFRYRMECNLIGLHFLFRQRFSDFSGRNDCAGAKLADGQSAVLVAMEGKGEKKIKRVEVIMV